MLIFASLRDMTNHLEDYDYFLNIEDDILITNEVLENIYEFDKQSAISEVFLPNRLESIDGHFYCTDIQSFPGWINTEKTFKNKRIKVAINPHSGVLILSKSKFKYAAKNIQLRYFMNTIGGPMASSYAHYHSPFTLFRSKDDLFFHYVIHLDNWTNNNKMKIHNLNIFNFKNTLVKIIRRMKFHIEELSGDHANCEKYEL